MSKPCPIRSPPARSPTAAASGVAPGRRQGTGGNGWAAAARRSCRRSARVVPNEAAARTATAGRRRGRRSKAPRPPVPGAAPNQIKVPRGYLENPCPPVRGAAAAVAAMGHAGGGPRSPGAFSRGWFYGFAIPRFTDCFRGAHRGTRAAEISPWCRISSRRRFGARQEFYLSRVETCHDIAQPQPQLIENLLGRIH